MMTEPAQQLSGATALEKTAIDTIRTLSMDAVQAVNSGHPGTAMRCHRSPALCGAAFLPRLAGVKAVKPGLRGAGHFAVEMSGTTRSTVAHNAQTSLDDHEEIGA